MIKLIWEISSFIFRVIFLGQLKKKKATAEIKKIEAEVKSVELDNTDHIITIYENAMELLKTQVAALTKTVEGLQLKITEQEKEIHNLKKHQEACDKENKHLKKRIDELEKK